MTEAIDTIRNTCSRRSQEERAEKTPEQRLLKAERRANEDLPCARASTRTCVAGAHICPRILGIGTFVRMWCTVRITLKSNGGTVMTGKVAIPSRPLPRQTALAVRITENSPVSNAGAEHPGGMCCVSGRQKPLTSRTSSAPELR